MHSGGPFCFEISASRWQVRVRVRCQEGEQLEGVQRAIFNSPRIAHGNNISVWLKLCLHISPKISGRITRAYAKSEHLGLRAHLYQHGVGPPGTGMFSTRTSHWCGSARSFSLWRPYFAALACWPGLRSINADQLALPTPAGPAVAPPCGCTAGPPAV